jgi:hypothetical protein
MSPPRYRVACVCAMWCCRCGVVVVIEVERCVDGSALALRMGGATVPFARNVERYARMPDRRCAFLKMLHDGPDVVSISRARSPPRLTLSNSESFMFQRMICFRTWYECPPPRRGRERARQELRRPPLLAIPSRSSQTLFQLRESSLRRRSRESSSAQGPEVIQKRLQAREARSTAPSGWALPVHFLRNRATFSPRSASILNFLCTELRALPWARCAQLVGPGAGGGVGNSPSVLRRRPSADGKRLYV